HAQTALTQLKQVYLDNTEQFSIESKYVKKENYTIQVGLPIGYQHSAKTYPVLYVLDGDKSFGMTKEITDWLTWDNEIRDIIVVGISYGKGTNTWWKNRARDYTQFKDTVYYYYPNAGGANDFLGFVKNELFPIINKNYRTNQDSNAIIGLSFGGLLTSYILFSQPDMFKSYIIISPSLFWNGNSILKTEADYFSKHKELNKVVYMAYGSLDDNDWVINPTNEFLKVMQIRKYEGLKFSTEVFKGETHISVFPMALTHGLKAVFKR
ncbi:MAG TPA: alpha/beta hydrolase-fold protein, partial [Bacteroidales bacterium]